MYRGRLILPQSSPLLFDLKLQNWLSWWLQWGPKQEVVKGSFVVKFHQALVKQLLLDSPFIILFFGTSCVFLSIFVFLYLFLSLVNFSFVLNAGDHLLYDNEQIYHDIDGRKEEKVVADLFANYRVWYKVCEQEIRVAAH